MDPHVDQFDLADQSNSCFQNAVLIVGFSIWRIFLIHVCQDVKLMSSVALAYFLTGDDLGGNIFHFAYLGDVRTNLIQQYRLPRCASLLTFMI